LEFRVCGNLASWSPPQAITQRHDCSREQSDVDGSAGRHDLAEGVPRAFTLNSNEVLEALQESLATIVRREKRSGAIASGTGFRYRRGGLVLTGGGALLRDLDKLLAQETGLPVIVAEDPLTCVARGGGRALEMMDKHTMDLLSSE